MWLIQAWMLGDIKWTESLAEILFSCTTCKSCIQSCKFSFNEDIVDILITAREEMVENGLVLPKVAHFFRNIEDYGNPYRELRQDRNKWAEDIEIPPYNDQEYLLYTGCVGSYDERGQKVSRALGKLLLSAGVSFGTLGAEEECEGNEVRILGEKRIFQELVDRNTRLFEKSGVKKIITLSPHSYNAFKNYYPDGFEVYHYTQLLSQLIADGSLRFSTKTNMKVTYHDPCFLGRHNDEYEAPRYILQSIPGVELIEMDRNRENSFCCGGGSANFYIDFFGGGESSPSRIRVREALKTGVNMLAVACPTCAMMLEEAVKNEGINEQQLVIKDISEILLEYT
jgi:Fe-S oxidoreductase